jgi:hypothetical protein
MLSREEKSANQTNQIHRADQPWVTRGAPLSLARATCFSHLRPPNRLKIKTQAAIHRLYDLTVPIAINNIVISMRKKIVAKL